MVSEECAKVYQQPITTIFTAVHSDLLKNLLRLTPKNSWFYLQVFTLHYIENWHQKKAIYLKKHTIIWWWKTAFISSSRWLFALQQLIPVASNGNDGFQPTKTNCKNRIPKELKYMKKMRSSLRVHQIRAAWWNITITLLPYIYHNSNIIPAEKLAFQPPLGLFERRGVFCSCRYFR